MKKNSFLTLLLALLSGILAFSCQSSKTKNQIPMVKQIPLEDFFRNPEKTSFKISPDGKYFSFMAPFQDRMNVFVQAVSSDSAIQLTYETERDLAGYTWANNDRILFLKDAGGDENYKLFGVNIDGSNLIGLTDFEGVRTEFIDDLEDNPEEIIIGLNKRDARFFDPYRLNVNTGELKMLAENPGNIQGWMTDHDGKLRVAVAIDGLETSVLYRATEQEEFKKVLTTNYKEELNPLFFTFDNQNIYATSNIGRDKSCIILFDIANGTEIESVYENSEVDVTSLSYSKKRKVLTAASYYTDKQQLHFFDDDSEYHFTKIKSLAGNYEVSISSRDKEEQIFIVRTYNDKSLGAYYVYDKNTEKLDLIHTIAPWLNEEDLAEMKPVTYTSRDGQTIHGYLTLPRAENQQYLPIVINPHGGPWARDHWGFNPEVQFLANRGFAVLQMNFRGSTGYGRTFKELSYKQWGKTMQDDITDGVNWLIDQKIADKKRIAIYGASYGGYATLAGLTFTPDLYCCGVDYVGVSNLFTFMKSIPPYWEQYLDMMYEMVGNPVEDSLLMKEVSPVFHAEKIKVPLFVAQGANDPRVNINESDQMVAAMKARGIEVEYMVKENEGHGFYNQENQFDFYRAMEKFLTTHMLK
jgi:dipeptidyl aminopeptidase/acylaminoacyl peptidase